MNQSIKNIAVAGGSGGLGAFITKALIRSNYQVTVLTRDTKTLVPGAKTVTIDYHNHDDLVEALRGIDAIVSTISGTALLDGQIILINAAVEAGVKRFLPSEFGVDLRGLDNPEVDFKIMHEVEHNPKSIVRKELIKHQDTMTWTFLNTGFFTDTTLLPELGFDLANKKVSIVGDGNALVSWTTRYDVGEFVVAILADSESQNQEINLVADVKTLNEIVSDIENIRNIKLSVTYHSAEEAISILSRTKFEHPYLAFIEELKRFLGSGYAYQKINDIARYTNVQTTTVHDFIKCSPA
ncbi:hypothetical protein K7432_012719 [Basidiobolus ranarum]|uniref:NmrA-like domain-containing protein n=1 Tax=Basidiobolus ranarum TaxID=34480 RepID=A0ABR2VRU7_9FUNG